MGKRLKNIRERMAREGYDSILITKKHNVYYLSGFTGTAGVLFITMDDAYLITDFRYIQQAKEQTLEFNVLKYEDTIWATLNNLVRQNGLNNIAFESNHVTYNQYERMKKEIAEIQLIPTQDIVEDLRIKKDEEEILTIERAARIADETFEYILDIIKPGISERDIACELEYFMKQKGAEGIAFDTIVASGIRSALPHGVADNKKIEKGDFVTLDFGCKLNRYCSDMTRTIVIGKPDEEQKKIYKTVFEAQKAAREYVKSGLTGEEVDKVARDIINLGGYEGLFGHGLGHGVGVEIHEAPRLAPGFKRKLEENMVVTIEPGIYINSLGGVRIEDLVVITEDGCRELSNSSRELISV